MELWFPLKKDVPSHELWLAAVAPIQPLAWEPPYAARAALEKAKEKEKENGGALAAQR